ncbi:MAG: hypothetical protein Q9191_002188 [Dirinaria sp. TL-2023a]
MATAPYSHPGDTADLFVLDENCGIQFQYLAEGAANIIYKPIGLPRSPSIEADIAFQPDETRSGTPPPTEIPFMAMDPRLDGKLLRLQKDLPTVCPVMDSYRHFQTVIRRLLHESEVIGQTLCKISSQVIDDLNSELRQMENDGKRSMKRHGNHLATDEPYGTLVTDMSPDGAHFSLEFKPKWLVQSPSAPKSSRRCRTCALQTMRGYSEKQDRSSTESDLNVPCPLMLTSGEKPDLFRFANHMLASQRNKHLQRYHWLPDLITNWLQQTRFLKKLSELQAQLDPKGVFTTDLADQNFLAAMTIRDCTLFLKIPRSPTAGPADVDARLGDLDQKSSEGGKAEYWVNTERRLIDEGWYTHEEEECGNHENLCYLARPRS